VLLAGFEDFDRYCAENNVQPDDHGEAFAGWIAERTDAPVPERTTYRPPAHC
jgi:hypothetical protein